MDDGLQRPGPPGGRLSALSVFLCKSVFHGAFVWPRGALNRRKRRFPAPRAATCLVHYLRSQMVTSPRFTILKVSGPGSRSSSSSRRGGEVRRCSEGSKTPLTPRLRAAIQHDVVAEVRRGCGQPCKMRVARVQNLNGYPHFVWLSSPMNHEWDITTRLYNRV